MGIVPERDLKIVVTGANGFIGSAVIEALLQANREVVAICRSSRNLPASSRIHLHQADLSRYLHEEDWLSALAGVQAIINCAGILREKRAGEFQVIHEQMPQALVAACLRLGIRKFVQVSALGTAADGEFIRSKHRFDDVLLASTLDAIVIRPSVVLSLRGSYGGTSLLRALAAVPYVLVLPGRGEQQIQPILLEDLAQQVLAAMEAPQVAPDLVYAVGPEVLSLRDYLLLLRNWLKLPAPYILYFPLTLMHPLAKLGQHLGIGPLGETIWGMLQRGNTAPAGAYDDAVQKLGHQPKAVSRSLQQGASFVQDRWHARLYLLRPALWLTLVFVWIISGIAGLLSRPEEFRPILDQLLIPSGLQQSLVTATSLLDIGLGLALLMQKQTRLVLLLMAASVLSYTALLGIFAPLLWLEPMGGLLKNLPVLGLLAIYGLLEDLR